MIANLHPQAFRVIDVTVLQHEFRPNICCGSLPNLGFVIEMEPALICPCLSQAAATASMPFTMETLQN